MAEEERSGMQRLQSRRAAMAAGLVVAALALIAAAPAPPPRVAMETPQGRIVVEVDVAHTPVTAANFLRHVDQGLYKGAHFYRAVRPDNDPKPAMPMQIIQGGIEPANSPLPPIAHETTAATGLRHDDGAISMARDAPGTATSEFFIVIGQAPGLDFGPGRNPDGQGYAVFGHVVEGMDVVRRINGGATGGGDGVKKGQMLEAPVPITAIRRVR
jgi:peptidyl-prolyl cis-trans isomerase A (cyclophilin A)